jgi:membrane protein
MGTTAERGSLRAGVAAVAGVAFSGGLAAMSTRWRRFFGRRIWLVRADELPRGRAAAYRVARVLYSTVRGFRENQLTFRAAGLTYYTVLSIVPFLAFAFSVLKGFGAYDAFVRGNVDPYVERTFGENASLLHAIRQVISFVDRTDVSRLGVVGLVVLAYTSINLLSTIEGALNDVWGAKQRRPFLRQVTDYVTLLVTTPLLALFATTLGAAAQSSRFVSFLRGMPHLGWLVRSAVALTPLVATITGLTALYAIMPNVRTRFRSVLLGGVVAGVLWQAALVLHVKFQIGVASYNALYAGFGAIPIFLVWLNVSWLIVLVGAQLGAADQNEQLVRQRLRATQADQLLKERIAVAVVAHASRAFLERCPRPTAAALAERLEVPLPTVDEVCEQLARAGVLARAIADHEIGFVPGRDLDTVRVHDVMRAMRVKCAEGDALPRVEPALGTRLAQLLADLEQAAVASPHNLTLRQLAGYVDLRRASAPEVHTARVAVLDGKQPEVPA